MKKNQILVTKSSTEDIRKLLRADDMVISGGDIERGVGS